MFLNTHRMSFRSLTCPELCATKFSSKNFVWIVLKRKKHTRIKEDRFLSDQIEYTGRRP